MRGFLHDTTSRACVFKPDKHDMNDAQIKHMVDRFLAWKLPDNFSPDGGISFQQIHSEQGPAGPQKHEPSGTNVFDAEQATAMVRYMVEGLSAPTPPAPTDEQIAAFDMAYLETLYPDRRDFVASGGRLREAIVAGLKAAALSTPTPEGGGLSEDAIRREANAYMTRIGWGWKTDGTLGALIGFARAIIDRQRSQTTTSTESSAVTTGERK